MTYYEIPVTAQPAQRFGFIMGDYEYAIRLKTSRDIISGADVSYHMKTAGNLNLSIGDRTSPAYLRLSGQTDGVIYRSDGELFMDLSVNGRTVFQGLRCDSSSDMLSSFKYLEFPGSLFFLTKDDAPPYWERLGSEDKLYYAL